MPPKGKKQKGTGRKTVHRKRRAPGMYGGSKFTDFFTKTIPRGLSSAGNFIKDKHIISGLLNLAPIPGAKIAGGLASMAGLGHPHMVVMPQKMAGRGRGHVHGTRVIRT